MSAGNLKEKRIVCDKGVLFDSTTEMYRGKGEKTSLLKDLPGGHMYEFIVEGGTLEIQAEKKYSFLESEKVEEGEWDEDGDGGRVRLPRIEAARSAGEDIQQQPIFNGSAGGSQQQPVFSSSGPPQLQYSPQQYHQPQHHHPQHHQPQHHPQYYQHPPQYQYHPHFHPPYYAQPVIHHSAPPPQHHNHAPNYAYVGSPLPSYHNHHQPAPQPSYYSAPPHHPVASMAPYAPPAHSPIIRHYGGVGGGAGGSDSPINNSSNSNSNSISPTNNNNNPHINNTNTDTASNNNVPR